MSRSQVTYQGNSLAKKDLISYMRNTAFIDCRAFMDKAHENGGINIELIGRPVKKSFPKNNLERVDVEIQKGIAFI